MDVKFSEDSWKTFEDEQYDTLFILYEAMNVCAFEMQKHFYNMLDMGIDNLPEYKKRYTKVKNKLIKEHPEWGDDVIIHLGFNA